jgi:hypothetical protein
VIPQSPAQFLATTRALAGVYRSGLSFLPKLASIPDFPQIVADTPYTQTSAFHCEYARFLPPFPIRSVDNLAFYSAPFFLLSILHQYLSSITEF